MVDLTAEDIGAAAARYCEMSAEHAQKVAAVLDADDELSNESALPLLWHWAFFTPAVPTAALGPDGHPPLPADGPTADLPRRMWAGGRVQQHAPLILGQPATRRSSITSAERKSGRSGDLLVVTARHEIEQSGHVVLTEEQDLIYRSVSALAVESPVGDERPQAPESGWADRVNADSVLLFRYSAVTFNSHRIHYDEHFVTADEGYPGLLVHGPLTATLLAESARRRGLAGTSFSYRASAPLFAGTPFTLIGDHADSGVSIKAIRNDGTVADGGAAQLTGVKATGMASGPKMKFDARHGSRVAGEVQVGQPAQQLGEHHLQLEPGQRRAQAEVRAEAEREVRVRVAVARRSRSGSANTAGVAVGRRVHQDQLVALVQRLAVHLDVARDRARHVLDRRDPAQQLLDADLASRAGRRGRIASWSGCSSSASIPSVMTWRVVSSPPMRISRLSWMIDSSSSRSPSISAWQRMLTRSSCGGFARRSAITPSWNSRNAMPASIAASRDLRVRWSVVPRIRSSDQRSRSSYDSGGKPSMSAISSSGSGAAMSQTKSHSPLRARPGR